MVIFFLGNSYIKTSINIKHKMYINSKGGQNSVGIFN